jgi:hypothetical protein
MCFLSISRLQKKTFLLNIVVVFNLFAYWIQVTFSWVENDSWSIQGTRNRSATGSSFPQLQAGSNVTYLLQVPCQVDQLGHVCLWELVFSVERSIGLFLISFLRHNRLGLMSCSKKH